MIKTKTIFCSICTLNYTAYANTLNNSLRKVGHSEPHYVLVIDLNKKYRKTIANFKFTHFSLKDVDIPRIDTLKKRYSAFELCNVLRPFFIHWLLKTRKSTEQVIYLDTDIFLYQPLTKFIFDFKNKRNSSLLLVPHLNNNKKYFTETGYEIEKELFKYGLYNSGIYSVKNNKNGFQFLIWHMKKLSEFGYFSTDNYMFVDQKILDIAPIIFDFVYIYKNPNINLGHWKYQEKFFRNKKQSMALSRQETNLF